MNREEAKAIILKEYLCVDRDCDIDRSCGKCDLMMPSKEPILEAYKMAIKALEQEPKTDSWSIKDVADTFKKHGLIREQEPCEDAISRENAIIRISWDFPTLEISKVKESLDKLPSVTPQPKTGHWSRKTKVDAYDIAGVKTWGIKCQCDRCDFTTIVVEDFGYYKYCPNCGCRMVEPQERSDKE